MVLLAVLLIAGVRGAVCSNDDSRCLDEVSLLQLHRDTQGVIHDAPVLLSVASNETSIMVGPSPDPSGNTNPWINEIHYLGDQDEGLEIAGPTGTDLSNYKIVKYDGSQGRMSCGGFNDECPELDTGGFALSGTLEDMEGTGYGVKWFFMTFENAGGRFKHEGVALVRTGGEVIQFLSYGSDGRFKAQEGPCAEMTSEHIPVEEPGHRHGYFSLQLKGTGTTYSDFTWGEAGPATHDMINVDQCFFVCPPPIAHPWINELHYIGFDEEGVEIAGPAHTDLSQYKIVLYNGKSGKYYDHHYLTGTLSDMEAGYGVKWFAMSPLQEGVDLGGRGGNQIPEDVSNRPVSGDGLALVYNKGYQVIQFLSYGEASAGVPTIRFEAIDGPASWHNVGKSTPIGVAESWAERSSANSLQLTGSGNKYSDFSWNPNPVPRSHDLINTAIGQTFTPAML
jgi:hypothetical protein